MSLTEVEVSKEALERNIHEFRRICGDDRILTPCVKANAYGHGLVEASRVFLESGADWLAVNALYEAQELREAGIEEPIYVLGYIAVDDLEEACCIPGLRMVIYNRETVDELAKSENPPPVHIKVETGNNRQGVMMDDLVEFARYVQKAGLRIEGLTTHFANIEDTTDHRYARQQLERFKEADILLQAIGIEVPIKHCANSAATLLFDEVRMDMVRPGIACYGMWPSSETLVSLLQSGKSKIELKPAFTWKANLAQVKEIEAGEFIGYGCTYQTTHKTRIGIVPVGYYDGYDRGVSNQAYVLVNGQRAAVLGRVCMNIIMIDLTDIPEAKLEDEVVLIGKQEVAEISAEQFAEWAGTINYEITTRVREGIERVLTA